jgi:hypothetical protein
MSVPQTHLGRLDPRNQKTNQNAFREFMDKEDERPRETDIAVLMFILFYIVYPKEWFVHVGLEGHGLGQRERDPVTQLECVQHLSQR